MTKTFIYNVNTYYSWEQQWIDTQLISPVESDYLTYGIDDPSSIPESAWSQLQGEVEICYYTNDPTVEEVSFNIETELFTLKDEWEDKTIQVIEYTDNPNRTESTITLDTEVFDLYDEFGDEVEVLYYTDDPNKTSAELEITANYSPLDEIEGDFEVVTYTTDENPKQLIVNGVPKAQLVISKNNLKDDLQRILVKVEDDYPSLSVARFALTFDSGVTWNIFKKDRWVRINSNAETMKKKAMTAQEVNDISSEFFEGKESIHLGYFIDENIRHSLEPKVTSSRSISISGINDVKFNDLAFYMLNTVATINLSFLGNKIKGVLNDEDKTRVQYRVILNGEPYHPASGEFTRLFDAPHNLNLIVDDRKIRFGESNTLLIEFKDYWGAVDSWSTNFIGTHSGIMFSDPSGQFYSTAFGEVLKKMDFGQIIAGQTTISKTVLLKNTIGYDVKNIRLDVIQPKEQGVKIELSKSNLSFVPEESLHYGDLVLEHDDSFEFYVRLTTEQTAEETPAGKFELRVNADKVD